MTCDGQQSRWVCAWTCWVVGGSDGEPVGEVATGFYLCYFNVSRSMQVMIAASDIEKLRLCWLKMALCTSVRNCPNAHCFGR